MDMKTNRWYLTAKLGDSTIEHRGEAKSLRAIVVDLAHILQTESGQFTRTNGEIMIRITPTPPTELDLLMPEGFVDTSAQYNPREGETREQYAERLSEDMPPATVAYMVADWFKELDETQATILARQQAWANDPQIQLVIRLNANNAAYERAATTEYIRLRDYALASYPDMCEDIVWRIAP